MSIPLKLLSENTRHQLGLMGESVTVASLTAAHDRGELKLEQLKLQLVPNMHNAHVRTRVRRKIEALEAALNEVFALITSSVVGSPFGGPREDVRGQHLGLLGCRSLACPELVTRHEAFDQAGLCFACWQIANGIDPTDFSRYPTQIGGTTE